MEEFVADPYAKIRSSSVHLWLAISQLPQPWLREVLWQTGLSLNEEYASLAKWLDTLRVIESQMGQQTLRNTTRAIFSTIAFPDRYQNVEPMLSVLDDLYHTHHVGEIGHYIVVPGNAGQIIVRAFTPYPSALEMGIFEGVCAHKSAVGAFNIRNLDEDTFEITRVAD